MIYTILFFSIIVLDFITKWFAIHNCTQLDLIDSILSCELSFNTGISWSFFQTSTLLSRSLLLLVIGSIIGSLFVYALKRYREHYSVYGECCILAGACANYIDRLWNGSVTDFIKMGFHGYYWPTFNVADIAICIGVIIVLFQSSNSCDT